MKNVYESFFGFQRKPFSLLPDPRFLFRSRTHSMAITLLEYGVSEQSGFVVLTGDSGTGKTILLRHLTQSADDDVLIATVTNTHPSSGDLMRWILLAFDLESTDGDPTEQHRRFVDHLEQLYAQGRRAILVIDEAQHLDAAALHHLRMLSNVNAEDAQLVQLIVVGQSSLRKTLQTPEMRSFAQRISVDYHLQPFKREDTIAYIRHRLDIAGGSPEVFDEEACAAVHYFSKGVPRLINSLCDLALVLSFAEDRPRVTLGTVVEGALARLQGGLSNLAPMPRELRPDEVRARILGES